jgi:hypothetical protein
MPLEKIQVALTPSEMYLVAALRELPESPLRARVLDVIDQLVSFAREPRCHEQQGDGVPCANVHTACDQCARVFEILAEFVPARRRP